MIATDSPQCAGRKQGESLRLFPDGNGLNIVLRQPGKKFRHHARSLLTYPVNAPKKPGVFGKPQRLRFLLPVAMLQIVRPEKMDI